MYACLYAPQAASLVADQLALFALAEAFSPKWNRLPPIPFSFP
jgi:hypothetical protein